MPLTLAVHYGTSSSTKTTKYDRFVTHPVCNVCFSSSVIHVPGVNDIQSSAGSAGQNLAQISRQINSSQVQWSGSRPPFSGQVRGTLHSALFYISIPCFSLLLFLTIPYFPSLMYFPIRLSSTISFHTSTGQEISCYSFILTHLFISTLFPAMLFYDRSFPPHIRVIAFHHFLQTSLPNFHSCCNILFHTSLLLCPTATLLHFPLSSLPFLATLTYTGPYLPIYFSKVEPQCLCRPNQS